MFPGKFPKSLAYTNTSDQHIEVLYDRIAAMVERIVLPKLLGHVLAHEIAHVLEGVARHSDTGILKARWDEHDVHDLAWKPLAFASEDVEWILRGVKRREQEQTALAQSRR